MTGFLLDANVVSETARPAPNPRVAAFLRDRTDLWLSVVVLHELEYGVKLLSPGARRDVLAARLVELAARHSGRILPVGRAEASCAARLRARARSTGRTVDAADALIAGTAQARDLALVTRNVRDFEELGVDVVNPWGALP